MAVWYVGSTKYTAVTAWAATTVYAAGDVRRQLAAPAAGSERCFVCIIAGTSLGSEPAWTLTKGAKTAEAAGPTWMECTGNVGINGDLTDTDNWNVVKNTAVALGRVIQRISSGSLQICTTAGTASNGAEPSFSNTAGSTTADGTVTWTSLGAPGNFAAYAAPHARLRNALASTWAAAGDTIYVSNNHAATEAAAVTLTFPGTAAAPNTIICVTDTAAPPVTTATTATESTTGASALSLASGCAYLYGIKFQSGSSSNNASLNIANAAAATALYLDTCGLTINNSGSSNMNLGQPTNQCVDSLVELRNCTYLFGATGQSLVFYSNFNNLIGGTFAGTGSVPTTAFNVTHVGASSNNAGAHTVRDMDISSVTGTLLGGNTLALCTGVTFTNNKLGTGVTLMSAPSVGPGGVFGRFHNNDSAATNYRYLFTNYMGSAQSETSVVRTSGATDGTTPLSWKLVSTSHAAVQQPFVSEEIAQWQDGTGSARTATIELTTDATLTNADCWLELEYLSASGAPLGAVASTKVALLATPVTLTTSAAAWSNGKANNYKITATFTPLMKGPIKGKLCVAKPSTTIYGDPLLTVA